MVKVRVVCRGTSPLLMQRLHEEGDGHLELPKALGQKRMQELTPREEAALNVYRHSGEIVLPRHCFRYCLRCAAEMLSAVKPCPKPPRWSERFARGVVINDLFLSLGATDADWTPRHCKLSHHKTKSNVVVVLPEFKVWQFAVTLHLKEQFLPSEAVRELIAYAGRRIGLGAMRPYHFGRFGQFEAVEWRRV